MLRWGILLLLLLAMSAHADVCELAEFASTGNGGDGYGGAVAADGNLVAVGALWDDENGFASGAVYVYRRMGSVWAFDAKLLPRDGGPEDRFGFDVAIDGERIAVGAPADFGDDTGAVYIYERIDAAWSQTAKLLATGGAIGDRFGRAIDLEGDRLAIGAPYEHSPGADAGAVYVFEHDDGVWSEAARLLASDGDAFDWFGRSVSLSGGTLAAGRREAFITGRVHVFQFNGFDWVETARLEGSGSDAFGTAVEVRGGVLVAGATRDDTGGADAGSVSVFRRIGGTWVFEDELVMPDAAPGEFFGRAIAINGERLLLGKSLDGEAGPAAGAVYRFDRDGGAWAFVEKILPTADDPVRFGEAVAWLDDDAMAITMFRGDNPGDPPSSAHVVTSGACPCPADLGGDNAVGFADLLDLLSVWGPCPGCPADLDGDGAVGFADLLAVLSAWGPC